MHRTHKHYKNIIKIQMYRRIFFLIYKRIRQKDSLQEMKCLKNIVNKATAKTSENWILAALEGGFPGTVSSGYTEPTSVGYGVVSSVSRHKGNPVNGWRKSYVNIISVHVV